MLPSLCGLGRRFLPLALLGMLSPFVQPAADDACVECHQNPKFRVQNKKLYDYYNDWMESTHRKAGVSCADCHGGDRHAESVEQAHDGGFLPSNPSSNIYFKNLPQTCGKCHQDVYREFTRSKHYRALINEQNAPHCATCHGSINSRVYYTSIVEPTCKSCHNKENKRLPDVANHAEEILQRLNISKAYMGWSDYYYRTKNWPGKMDELVAQYQHIADSWHRFKLDETDRDSAELYVRLKTVFDEAWREKLANERPNPKSFMPE